jgi:hypothetical protein
MRIENDQFVATVVEAADGTCTATIDYKNGARQEKWVTASKDELTKALLTAKGHASLRVKEAVRRERLGGPKLDKQYQLPPNITPEKFNRYPDEVKTQVIEAVALKNASLFRDLHPEFIASDKNGLALNAFLQEHNMPMTVRNLEHAMECLLEENKLDVKKAQTAPPPVKRRVETVVADDDAHQSDDYVLTEAQAKAMPLAQLKAAALKSRRAHSTVDQKLVDRGTLHAVI